MTTDENPTAKFNEDPTAQELVGVLADQITGHSSEYRQKSKIENLDPDRFSILLDGLGLVNFKQMTETYHHHRQEHR